MRGLIKRILKKLYNVYITRKNEIKAMRHASLFLKRGFYYIPHKQKNIKRIDRHAFSLKNIFHIYPSFLRKKSSSFIENYEKERLDKISFAYGQGKIVLLTKENAYGFYNTQNGYNGSKKNYENNFDAFNYPSLTVRAYDDKLKCVIMDNVKGVEHDDSFHDRIIIEKLIEFCSKAAVKEHADGTVVFLQHGDAAHVNVLWQDAEFIFIDLDNINYYPPLLDVLHYLCGAGYNLSEMVLLLENKAETVKEICRKAKLNAEENYIDEVLYGYLNHYIKMNCNFEDFRFLNMNNTIKYPKTNELLGTIDADNHNVGERTVR